LFFIFAYSLTSIEIHWSILMLLIFANLFIIM
jgi:cytochrome b561